MRAQPQIAKGALSRRMQIRGEKELEDTYQLLKSFIQPKPYPSFEGFQTVLDDLAKRIPAAKTADPKQFVDVRFIDEMDRAGYIDAIVEAICRTRRSFPAHLSICGLPAPEA
jgi:hypothetical protein